jgi:hypothetical protein
MPTLVTAGPENTWTIPAAYDLFEVDYLTNGESSMINWGPGDIWFTFVEGNTPAYGATNCLMLKPYGIYNSNGVPLGRAMRLKMIATQASTIISMNIGKPERWPTE